MGPRLQERGVGCSLICSVRDWPGFNGAALTRARSCETRRSLGIFVGLLQWGRAYKSAEFAVTGSKPVSSRTASMGPRLQERGVDNNPMEVCKRLSGFNGAALTRARSYPQKSASPPEKKDASMGPRLQERGVLAAVGTVIAGSSCFNGAALTRARSYGQTTTSAQPHIALQWGRAYKSAELENFKVKASPNFLASMGPRLQERGVIPSFIGAVPEVPRFNGAALTRARSCNRNQRLRVPA